MTIKAKLQTAAIAILILVVIAQLLFHQESEHKSEVLIEQLYQIQSVALEKEKEVYAEQIDSLKTVVHSKEQHIENLQKNLYRSIQKSRINNQRYEELKKNADRITNADSLGRILTNRYKKR